ncbi:MAG: hypothetical protein V8Q36_04605 [Anaerotignum sp.]
MKKTNDTPMEDFQALYNRQVNRVYRLALNNNKRKKTCHRIKIML